MASKDGAQAAAEAALAATASKPKRVRTGCLTCRERHLKCDETPGVCDNCRKSARECKRGVRLNFIDTRVEQPPVILTAQDWRVEFLDESRDIASEYTGGDAQYARQHEPKMAFDTAMDFQYDGQQMEALQAQQAMQSVNVFDQPEKHYQQEMRAINAEPGYVQNNIGQHQYTSPYQAVQAVPTVQQVQQEESSDIKEYLNTQEETLYMQVFVEEVGLWMDSMDPMKHYQEEKALAYYESASRYLLRALENPERDSVICATTAVILNVYEIMTEKALMRMNHIAGARALIKECGWNARSSGIGAACFWVNVGMELLSNLHFNWRASWAPDLWGFHLDLTTEQLPGREESWTHKILYITAKVGDFRAMVPKAQDTTSAHEESRRRQERYKMWLGLKETCDTWNTNIPRTMHPVAHLYPYQTRSNSAFPEVWLVKRTTIIARLFYHTAMLLLTHVNPIMTKEAPEMHEMEQHHAHMICGIAAHVKDREQEEALSIFIRIHKETGWRIGFIPVDLMEKWGWDPNVEVSPQLPTQDDPTNHYLHKQFSNGFSGQSQYSAPMFDQYAENKRLQENRKHAVAQNALAAQRRDSHLSPNHAQHARSQSQPQHLTPPGPGAGANRPSPASRSIPPQGIVNPLFGNADFSAPKHPYQEYYVAPSHHMQQQSQNQNQSHPGLSLALMGLNGPPSQVPGYAHAQEGDPHGHSQGQGHGQNGGVYGY